MTDINYPKFPGGPNTVDSIVIGESTIYVGDEIEVLVNSVKTYDHGVIKEVSTDATYSGEVLGLIEYPGFTQATLTNQGSKVAVELGPVYNVTLLSLTPGRKDGWYQITCNFSKGDKVTPRTRVLLSKGGRWFTGDYFGDPIEPSEVTSMHFLSEFIED